MNNHLAKLHRIALKKSRIIVGLMSGTSLDGLDVALCRITGHGLRTKVSLLEFETIPYRAEVKERIRGVFAKNQVDFQKLCLLHPWLARFHGDVVTTCLKGWKYPPNRVDCVASHGQTVFHSPAFLHPEDPSNATFQVGDGDHLAARTGIITISDFRQKHIASGGEGAPLAVYGDYLLFSHRTENRILLNVGGIANFTWLLAGKKADKVVVTDTGPGNTLIDQAVRTYYPGKDFDRDAVIARSGHIHGGLLQALKTHPFFHRPFPKTTGPELFNMDYVARAQKASDTVSISAVDLIATLTRFSAETIAEAIMATAGKRSFEIYVSGGGGHNPLMMEELKQLLKIKRLQSSDVLGISGDAKEAILFAVLANETLAGSLLPFGKKSRIPSVRMGKISFPD